MALVPVNLNRRETRVSQLEMNLLQARVVTPSILREEYPGPPRSGFRADVVVVRELAR